MVLPTVLLPIVVVLPIVVLPIVVLPANNQSHYSGHLLMLIL